MELNHFSHEHPLVLMEEEDPNVDNEEADCFGCRQQIFDACPAYSCSPCNFFLHKSCAELPKEINHFLHPEHPLILTADSPNYNENCRACTKRFGSFTYNCSPCTFYLHVKCAMLPHSVKHNGHKHPLTLLLKPATFDCDVCGIERRGISYLCTTCQFWVHPKCFLFPTFVVTNSRLHKHPLILTCSLRVNNSGGIGIVIYCEICHKKVNQKHWFYHCAECSFVTHVGCSTSKKLQSWGLRGLSILTESEGSCTDLIARYVKKTGVGEDERTTQFKHFSHEHCLTLRGDDDDDNVIMTKKDDDDDKCDACIQPISAPFYSCDDQDCNFFLHESCSKLPRKMRHPLHKLHQLTLLAKACFDGVFQCSACNFLCNGFAYSCLECNFHLDIKCSVVPRSIKLKHKSQNFKFSLGSINPGNCIACGLGEAEFKSVVRYFDFLHFRCAMLPRMVRHRFHKHPLILRTYPIEDEVEDPNQCICDICEDLRDPYHWFYYCADCNFTAHLDCAEDPFKYIKFGRFYEYEAHPHLLTLIKETQKNRDIWCELCGDPCKTMALACTECKFIVHLKCDM